jgi:transposase
MIYEPNKYIAIHQLISEEVPYETIAAMLNISKNTVTALKKRENELATIFPSRTRKSKYDPYIKELSNYINYYMNQTRNTCQLYKTVKLTSDEIYELIKDVGFYVTKTKFKELYTIENNKRKESYLKIHYNPGEIVQFDWGYRLLNINGKNKRIYFAVYVFPYSNYKIAYVTEKEDGKSFAKTFDRFTNDVCGTAPIFVIDNMKIAKRIHDPTQKDKQLTLLFSELSKHYNFEVLFCAPRRPNQKGTVENGVGIIKEALEKSYIQCFKDLNAVQSFVDQIFNVSNEKMHPSKNDTCQKLFAHEEALLQRLPQRQYTYYALKKRTVNRDSMVTSKNSKYSLPEGYQGQQITLRYNDYLLYILSDNGDILAKHPVSKKKKSRTYRVWHMLNKLKMKPQGFTYSEEYRSMPKWLKTLYIQIFNEDTASFISFLEYAQGKQKDFLKKCLRRNQIEYHELTVELLHREIERL